MNDESIPDLPNNAASEPQAPPQGVPDTASPALELNQQGKAKAEGNHPAHRMKHTKSRILDRVKTGERWMILLTGVVALSAVFQTVQSCNNNASTSKQVDRLICAADQIQQAANNFSESAKGINSGVDRAVAKLDLQAGAAKTSAEAMKKMASATQTTAQVAQTALQPAIAARVIMSNVTDKSMKYELKIRNEGGTQAVATVRYCVFSNIRPSPAHSVSECGVQEKVAGPFTVLPHNEYPIAISVDDMPAQVQNGQTYFYMPVEISYTYAKVAHVLPYCFLYEEAFKSMGDCNDVKQYGKQQQK